jgi:hypothetical protein
MPDIELKVTGLTEAVNMLESMPKNIVVLGFARGLEAAGQVLQAELYNQTPVRTEVRSAASAARTGRTAGEKIFTGGELRAALRRKVTIDANYRGGYVTIDHGRMGWLANIIEYGHRIVGHKPGLKDTGKFVPPNPMYRRTAEIAAEPAIEAFVKEINEVINEAQTGTVRAA